MLGCRWSLWLRCSKPLTLECALTNVSRVAPPRQALVFSHVVPANVCFQKLESLPLMSDIGRKAADSPLSPESPLCGRKPTVSIWRPERYSRHPAR